MRMTLLVGIFFRLSVACATLRSLVIAAFIEGRGAVISQRLHPVKHNDALSPFLSTTENRAPAFLSDEWERLFYADGNLPCYKNKFLFSKTKRNGSFAQANPEDFDQHLGSRRRRKRDVSLPLVDPRGTLGRVALRASLILVAMLSAAFAVFTCARHVGRLGSSGQRFLAEDKSLGACGGTEVSSSDLPEISESMKEKIIKVLKLIEKLAVTCKDVLDEAPVIVRIKGTQLMLGSAIQELAALAVLLGENMQEKRKAVAEVVLDVAEGLILKDSIKQTGGGVRTNLRNLQKFLRKVKDNEPGLARIPHEERTRLLGELLELQAVGLTLQIAGASNLVPEDTETETTSLMPEKLKRQLECEWGNVTLARSLQIFSNAPLSDWLRENQIMRKSHGLLLKLSTAERLKHAGGDLPEPPLTERIHELHIAITRGNANKMSVSHASPQLSTGPPIKEEAAADSDELQPSGGSEQQHEILDQEALPAATPALHLSHTPSHPSAAQLQNDSSSSSVSQQQQPMLEVPPRGPLIGLPFSLMAVLRRPPQLASTCSESSQQQPAAVSLLSTESASVHEVTMENSEHSLGAPKAPHGSQLPFKGHPFGEPSPCDLEKSDT